MNLALQSAKALALSSLLAGSALPAWAAWESGSVKHENARQDYAVVFDTEFITAIEVGCYIEPENIFGELYLILFTGEEYDDQADYPETVPLTLRTGSVAIELTHARPTVQGNELTLDISELEDEWVWDALEAIEDATGPIELVLDTIKSTFPHENAAETVGAILDLCRDGAINAPP